MQLHWGGDGLHANHHPRLGSAFSCTRRTIGDLLYKDSESVRGGSNAVLKGSVMRAPPPPAPALVASCAQVYLVRELSEHGMRLTTEWIRVLPAAYEGARCGRARARAA